jgi:hypothetical protein
MSIGRDWNYAQGERLSFIGGQRFSTRYPLLPVSYFTHP